MSFLITAVAVAIPPRTGVPTISSTLASRLLLLHPDPRRPKLGSIECFDEFSKFVIFFDFHEGVAILIVKAALDIDRFDSAFGLKEFPDLLVEGGSLLPAVQTRHEYLVLRGEAAAARGLARATGLPRTATAGSLFFLHGPINILFSLEEAIVIASLAINMYGS